jgi:hypothetical protein
LAVYLLFHYTPLTGTVKEIPVHNHSEVPYTWWKRGLAVIPGIVGAFWHTAMFILSRRIGHLISRQNFWLVGTLAGLAIVVFVRATLAFPTNARMAFIAMAVDAERGNIAWETVVSRGAVGGIEDSRAAGASPTPCTDGTLVFVHFGSVTACLDFKGQMLWRHIDSQYPSSVVYGAASSPVLVNDRLIVIQDRERWSR